VPMPVLAASASLEHGGCPACREADESTKRERNDMSAAGEQHCRTQPACRGVSSKVKMIAPKLPVQLFPNNFEYGLCFRAFRGFFDTRI
jgi:hypothetical protein